MTKKVWLNSTLLATLLLLPACTSLDKEMHQFQPTATLVTEFVVSIPQKALWKNYVTVSVEAIPETECTLTYVSPSGVFHETKAVANSNGLCTWKWKVDETEGKGASRLIFTINNVSETHFMEIRSGF